MKSMNRCLACVVVGLSVAAGAAWALSIQTIGGNTAVLRDGVDSGFGPFYLLDSNHPFTSAGALNRWEIFAQATNPVQLVIYRQENGLFKEVGRSAVVTPVLGYNLFELATAINVQPGDFVGAFFPTKGAVSDSINGGRDFCPANLGHAVLFSTTTSTGFGFSCDRTYSLRAFEQQNEQ